MTDPVPSITRHLLRQPTGKRNRRRVRRLAARLPLCRLILPGGESFPVKVVNLSLYGIGLAGGYAVPEGLIVQVQLFNRAFIFSLSIGVEVVHLGGRFSRPLSYEELAPFLR
jgi:hypothetical protein